MNEAVYMFNENDSTNNEMMYQASFDHSNTGICHMSLDSRFIRVNNAFSRMLGFASQELINVHLNDVTYADDLNLSKSEYNKLIEGKKDYIKFHQRFIKKMEVFFGQELKHL